MDLFSDGNTGSTLVAGKLAFVQIAIKVRSDASSKTVRTKEARPC